MIHTEQWMEITKDRHQEILIDVQNMRLAMNDNVPHDATEWAIVARIRKILTAANRSIHGKRGIAQAA